MEAYRLIFQAALDSEMHSWESFFGREAGQKVRRRPQGLPSTTFDTFDDKFPMWKLSSIAQSFGRWSLLAVDLREFGTYRSGVFRVETGSLVHNPT